MSSNTQKRTARCAQNAIASCTDEELILSIAQIQDKQAFGELYRRFERTAFNLASYLTSNKYLAEEAVQEAMLRIWSHAQTFRNENSARGWILRIVANASFRAASVDRRIRSREGVDEAMGKSDAIICSGPEDRAGQQEIHNALRKELMNLTPENRCLIGLYYGAGLTQQEISRELSIPQTTVSERLRNGLDTLRARLSAAGFAAAAPLLGSEDLAQVLSSGLDAPKSLKNRIFANLGCTGRQKDPAFPAVSAVRIFGYVVLLAVLSAPFVVRYVISPRALISGTQDSEVNDLVKSPGPAVSLEKSDEGISFYPASVDLPAHWDFNASRFEAALKRCGSWEFGVSETLQRNILYAPRSEGGPLFLKLPLGYGRPLAVDVKGIGLGEGEFRVFPVWVDDGRTCSRTIWRAKHARTFPVRQLLNFRFYVVGQRIVSYVFDDYTKPIQVDSYSLVGSKSGLCISCALFGISEISAREVTEEELLRISKEPDNSIKEGLNFFVESETVTFPAGATHETNPNRQPDAIPKPGPGGE